MFVSMIEAMNIDDRPIVGFIVGIVWHVNKLEERGVHIPNPISNATQAFNLAIKELIHPNDKKQPYIKAWIKQAKVFLSRVDETIAECKNGKREKLKVDWLMTSVKFALCDAWHTVLDKSRLNPQMEMK